MAVEFHNTGVMCMVTEADFCNVDLGNYFVKSDTQEQVLITSERLATKYGHLVKVPIYTRKETDDN